MIRIERMKPIFNKRRNSQDSGDETGEALDLRQPKPLDQTSPSANDHDSTLTLQSSFGNAAVARSMIQRKAAGDDTPGVASAGSETAMSPSEASAGAVPATQSWIVEDNAETLTPGQMKKTDFLTQLRSAVNSTAGDALAGSPLALAATPYIENVFAQYAAQSSSHLEGSLRRYAPEAAAVTNAGSYIPIVTSRVRRSLITFVTTGQQPDGLPMGLPATGTLGAGDAVSSVASAVTDVASNVASAIGGAVSAVSSLLFKEHDGGAAEVNDPQAIQDQLGSGQSLDASVRSRMELAFGESFSGVEVHADSKGAELSENLNARAFTVGRHIAFGAAEYKPGTLIGDALIAHELAHVSQQRGGIAGPAAKGPAESGRLEEDADHAAVGAVVSSWAGAGRGLAKISNHALSSLKSGLRLQRCRGKKASPPAPIPAPRKGQTYEEWLKTFPGFDGNRDISSAAPEQLKGWVVGRLGVSPDCADVSLALRHFYLQSQEKTTTFRAGPGKGKEFQIGFGVTDAQLRANMQNLGSINFQEDRRNFRLVNFYKKDGANIRNLKQLIEKGLKPGDVIVFKKRAGEIGNYEGHVQTVQAIDVPGRTLTVVQGNMDDGAGTGELQQRQYTFLNRTGAADGDANMLDQNAATFFGAGTWIE